MAGPCWIAVAGTYATTTGRELDLVRGTRVQVDAKVSLRRASGRSDVRRASWTAEVTGDPNDQVTVRLGSPQAVAACITGVRDLREE